MKDLKDKLKQARIENGFTQKQVAQQVGITPNAIANYELGTREPSLDTLAQLCKCYGVSADYLLGLTEY